MKFDQWFVNFTFETICNDLALGLYRIQKLMNCNYTQQLQRANVTYTALLSSVIVDCLNASVLVSVSVILWLKLEVLGK